MNAERVGEQLVRWLRSEVESSDAGGLVFGLSGGVDSAVVAGLARRARPDDHLALILPIDSEPRDLEDAGRVVEAFELTAERVDLSRVYRQFAAALGVEPDSADDLPLPPANLKARLRMAALYYHANDRGYLVAGTGNRSELTLGYFTKYGDGGSDLLPLGHLVKSEVREMAVHLGVPESIIEKPPSAGLWPGHTDEGELGFSYEQLEEYLLTGQADPGIEKKIVSRRRANAHKLRTPRMPPPPATS